MATEIIIDESATSYDIHCSCGETYSVRAFVQNMRRIIRGDEIIHCPACDKEPHELENFGGMNWREFWNY